MTEPPRDVRAVLRLDPRASDTPDSLTDVARDEGRDPSLRYAALRRLEEVAPASVLAVAEIMAVETSSTVDLRANAVAILVRSSTPQAADALERVRRSSPEAAGFVTQVSRLNEIKGGR